MATDHRHMGPDGRRYNKDRRTTPCSLSSSSERRAKTVLREACVLEIPLAPLIGSYDRRAGDRRHSVPAPKPWREKAAHIIEEITGFWHKPH